jgi:hypothetical protein
MKRIIHLLSRWICEVLFYYENRDTKWAEKLIKAVTEIK